MDTAARKIIRKITVSSGASMALRPAIQVTPKNIHRNKNILDDSKAYLRLILKQCKRSAKLPPQKVSGKCLQNAPKRFYDILQQMLWDGSAISKLIFSDEYSHHTEVVGIPTVLSLFVAVSTEPCMDTFQPLCTLTYALLFTQKEEPCWNSRPGERTQLCN